MTNIRGLVVRPAAIILAAAMLSSCGGAVGSALCDDVAVEPRQLAFRAIERLVRATHGGATEKIAYESVAAFLAANPSCCFVQSPRDFNKQSLPLPLPSPTELAIIYRKHVDKSDSRTVRHVEFGPCGKDMEYSEQQIPLSQVTNNWGTAIAMP